MAESEHPRGLRLSRRVLSLLEAVPNKWLFFAVAALVLGVSALFGGLNDSTQAKTELPQLTAGETFVGPEFTTTILGAELTDLAPGLSLEPDDGNTYLVVTATVTNTWTVSTIAIDDLLVLEWLDSESNGEADRTTLVSDGTSLPLANPGVPMQVAWIWEVPQDTLADGDALRVSIQSKTLTEDGDVTYGSYWSDPVVAAHVDMEVGG